MPVYILSLPFIIGYSTPLSACLPAGAGLVHRPTALQQLVFHFLLETQQNRAEPEAKTEPKSFSLPHTLFSSLPFSPVCSVWWVLLTSFPSQYKTPTPSFILHPYIGTHNRRAIDISFSKKP
jgi:hypothetical protein